MPQSNIAPYRPIYRLIAFIARSILKIAFGLKINGLDNIPKNGAFIFASNHRSIIDPPVLGSVCPREVFYAAKKELLEVPIFGWFIAYLNAVPVRRTGYDRGVLKLLGNALDNGYGITIFPEGTRSRDGNLGKPRPGVGVLSKNHNAVIVPVFISGSSNIMQQVLKRKLAVQFGEVLQFNADFFSDTDDDKDSYRKIAAEVIRNIAKLGAIKSPV